MTTPKKYGITENKKAELDALTVKVSHAQLDVERLQAIVDALSTGKSPAVTDRLLDEATTNLIQAQIILKSSQAELSAVNAAALAS